MTDTQSLSERLRGFYGPDTENYLDQDDAEPLMREAADALDQQAAEIDLMKEGRRLHDELTDHLEADLEAAREALYTLVSHAALHEEYTSHPTDEDVVQISLGELRRARKALAAIRAKEQP